MYHGSLLEFCPTRFTQLQLIFVWLIKMSQIVRIVVDNETNLSLTNNLVAGTAIIENIEAGTITTTNAINCTSLIASGAVQGASVTATGPISGTTVNCGTLNCTGTVVAGLSTPNQFKLGATSNTFSVLAAGSKLLTAPNIPADTLLTGSIPLNVPTGLQTYVYLNMDAASGSTLFDTCILTSTNVTATGFTYNIRNIAGIPTVGNCNIQYLVLGGT